MSGWGDPKKLAEARAAHAEFTGRSSGPRGHVANGRAMNADADAGAGAGAGRGRNRGRGRSRRGASPKPTGGSANSGNNKTTAGRRRGSPSTQIGFGFGSFDGNNTARVGGGDQSTVPLATSDEFFSRLNSQKKDHAPPAEPKSPKRGLMSSSWATTPGASDTGKDLKNDQSTPGTNSGLFASLWAKSPSPLPNPSELPPIYRSENWLRDLHEEHAAEKKGQPALVSAGPPGHANGDSCGPNTEPALRDLVSVGAPTQTQVRNPSAQASIEAPKQANNTPAQLATCPAPVSNASMQGQAHTQSPNVIQSATQPRGQQNVGPSQFPFGASNPTVNFDQGCQPSSAQLHTRAQPQQTQAQAQAAFITIGAHASPDTQSYHPPGSSATLSPTGFGAGTTSQPVQQPVQQPARTSGGKVGQQLPQTTNPVGGGTGQRLLQTANPVGGGAGQRLLQPDQPSNDPFDDPAFKDFWENHYLRNNG